MVLIGELKCKEQAPSGRIIYLAWMGMELALSNTNRLNSAGDFARDKARDITKTRANAA